jgi:undecaprenyl-diphosphatase
MDLVALDYYLFFLVNHGMANPLFDVVMPVLTSKGYLLLFPYLAYMIIEARRAEKTLPGASARTSWAIVLSVGAFLLSDWFGHELKHLIGRVRPCNALQDVRLLVGCTTSGSMPSNHATNSFAVALTLFWMARGLTPLRWRLYPVVLAAVVAFSRICVGVHYPGDVIAGTLLGILIAAALTMAYSRCLSAYRSAPYATVLYVSLAVISIFRVYYILHGPLDLSPDEAHYWEWSRRPDLSYYSKGPMIAYLILVGTSLFGDTVFGVRVLAVVFSALSSVVVYRLGCGIYGSERPGVIAGLLLQVIPLFACFGVIFTIDSPFIFFWVLGLSVLRQAVQGVEPGQSAGKASREGTVTPGGSGYGLWLVLGVIVGLGLLTKYTMALFYLCSFMFLLFSAQRRLLMTAKPYAAFAVSLIVFSPVILWNISHDWVTLKHTAGQAHVSEGFRLSLTHFFDFLGSQVGVITPLLFGLMAYAIVFNRKALESLLGDHDRRLLLWFSVPVIGFFLLKSLQGKVQANWALPGYLSGTVALAGVLAAALGSRGAQPGGRAWKILTVSALVLSLLVTTVAYYPSVLKLPPKLDPTARLRGWRELGREVSKVKEELGNDAKVVIISDSYQVASELAFYVKGQPTTYCINLGRRMNQYDLWADLGEAAGLTGWQGHTNPYNTKAIFVRIGDAEVPPALAQASGHCTRRLLRVEESGKRLREYTLAICEGFRGIRTDKPLIY